MIYNYSSNDLCFRLITKLYSENTEIIENAQITFSDEIPPYIIKDFKGSVKGIDIEDFNLKQIPVCQFLGQYFPETSKIKIYLKGISLVSNRKRIDFKLLTQIILIHELSHYLSHHYRLNNKKWETKKYSIANPEIHEFIAQLSTFLLIKNEKDLLNVFEQLSEFQPQEYQSYKLVEDPSISFRDFFRIVEGIRRLEEPNIDRIGRFIPKYLERVFNSNDNINKGKLTKLLCKKDEKMYLKDTRENYKMHKGLNDFDLYSD